MRKIKLLIFLFLVNFTLLSCTEENLADITNSPEETYATGGEDAKNDPDEEPPGGEL